MEFESSNFLSPNTPDDRLIQIRDTDGNITYIISPCDISRVYVISNFLKIQTINEVISIKFSTSGDALVASQMVTDRSIEIKDIFPCDPIPEPTEVIYYNSPSDLIEFKSSNFLSPGTTSDRLIQIRNNSGEVIYTISPCDVNRTYVISNFLKIQTVNEVISIKFSTITDATSALSILNLRISEIKSVFPCDSPVFTPSTFLTTYTESDKLIQIKDSLNNIIFTINPCDIRSTYTVTNSLKIQTIGGLISVTFLTTDDAVSSLGLINIRIDEIKSIFPCSVVSESPSSTAENGSIFSSDSFLLAYSDGERKVQIRNTNGVVTYTIDPCNVVLVYVKNSSRSITVKSVGSENLLRIEFVSNSDALYSLNKLQERIDFIKSIYPCNSSGSAGFTHIQSFNSELWQINHRLGRRPSVFVMDGGYEEIEGLIKNIDDNNTYIYFNTPVSGSAYLI